MSKDDDRLDSALAEYMMVRKPGLDPNDVRAVLRTAYLMIESGQWEEATHTYLKAARIYEGQGFFLKALAVYKSVLKIDADCIDAKEGLRSLYRQLGLEEDANNVK